MNEINTLAQSASSSIRSLKQAQEIAGTIGHPSKMPGMSYGIPADNCHVGSKLSQHAGTTCSHCYAKKAKYRYQTVTKSQAYRLASLTNESWVDAMVFLIERGIAKRGPWFRWHDSGDIQGFWHLLKIVEIAERMPHVNFWLPTREYSAVKAYLQTRGNFPSNLTVRVSAPMIDGEAPTWAQNSSTVHDKAAAIGQSCPAPTQGNQCGECRACWDKNVANVSYHVH